MRFTFENDTFLKRVITDDEKWIVHGDIERKESWSKRDEPAQSISKAEIRQRKVTLSIWWDWKGIVFFELLPRDETINSSVYRRQLVESSNAIRKKRAELANRKGVVFRHDKTPYVIGDSSEIVAARTGRVTTSSLFTKLCTVRLSLVSLSLEFFERKNL